MVDRNMLKSRVEQRLHQLWLSEAIARFFVRFCSCQQFLANSKLREHLCRVVYNFVYLATHQWIKLARIGTERTELSPKVAVWNQIHVQVSARLQYPMGFPKGCLRVSKVIENTVASNEIRTI